MESSAQVLHAPRGWHNRGYVPHFDGGDVTQHVTIRLADSLPQSVLAAIRAEVARERDHLGRRLCQEDAKLRVIGLAEKYLDQGLGSCVLKQTRAAKIVDAAFRHFDRSRYRLHAWCVMPNHAHVLFTPSPGEQLGRIVHSWKSFTANAINRALGTDGQLWMYDYFDRYIRNESHFWNVLAYIVQNPVSAGLCEAAEDWLWTGTQLAESDLEGRGPRQQEETT